MMVDIELLSESNQQLPCIADDFDIKFLCKLKKKHKTLIQSVK